VLKELFWKVYRYFFPKYKMLDVGVRQNIYTKQVQAYCNELCEWFELEYLRGTNYDGGHWACYPYYWGRY
jgi:hypothetical protein